MPKQIDFDVEVISPESVETIATDKLILPFGVGIDCHSRFIQVCILVRRDLSIVRHEKSFTTLWPSLLNARVWIINILDKYKLDSKDFHYCIESTGTYHYPVIHAFGGKPSIVNPLLAGSSKRKTDVLDARVLAQQSITALWPVSYFPSESEITLKVLTGERQRAMKRRLQASNRINNIILRFGHTIFAKAGFGDFTKNVLEDMLDNRQKELDVLSSIELPEPIKQRIKYLMDDWFESNDEVKNLQKQLKSLVSTMTYKLKDRSVTGSELLELLQTVPGIGEISALTWIVEIGDINRFKNSKALSAYCGCDPSLKVSAGHVTNYTRRGGNETIHRVLIQSASSLVQRKKEPFGQWGYRLYSQKKKGGWKKACGAVARRLAVAMYWVHFTGKEFTYESYNFWRSLEVPEVLLEEMGFSSYVFKKLKALGFQNSLSLIEAYQTNLSTTKGVGEKCLQEIANWVKTNNKGYALSERSVAEKERLVRRKIWDKTSSEQPTKS